ncbi:MAG: hypothetical protein K6B64_04195 [Acholeplasmatales bacterium]|nr:hypothetical protein [Acholeplasmatales bacterium]
MFNDVNGLIDKVFTNNDGKWDLYLFKAAHRNYKIRQVSFPDGALASIRNEAIEKLSFKLESITNMVDYKTFLDDNSVKRLDLNDESIKEMYEKFLSIMENKDVVEDNEDKSVLQPSFCDGYVLVKTLEEDDNKKLYLFSKSKVVPKKRLELVNSDGDSFEVVNSSNFVALSNKINFVIYDGYLYSLDYKFEKVFFVGDYLSEKVSIIINELEVSGKLTPAAIFAIRNSKSKRELLKYDMANFELLTKENLRILDNYADFEPVANQLTFEDDFSAKVFIKLMAGKLFFIDGKAYTGNKEELQRPIEEENDED